MRENIAEHASEKVCDGKNGTKQESIEIPLDEPERENEIVKPIGSHSKYFFKTYKSDRVPKKINRI